MLLLLLLLLPQMCGNGQALLLEDLHENLLLILTHYIKNLYRLLTSEPISVNQPAYSNVNANTNASGAQCLPNPGRYFDTKTKANYIPKNLNQLTMTGKSSIPARIEDTSSGYYPRAPAVAPVQFAPHHVFEKSDSSENQDSKLIENKPVQRTQSQLPLVRGRGDLCGLMNKADVRLEFPFLQFSLDASKSVSGNSDLVLQLPEHIQELRIWKCENPLGGNHNQYQDATWNAIEKVLSSTVGRSAIAASECRYEAALILRNACLKDLTLGEVLQILNMIINLKRWIKTYSDWQPITITLPETSNDKDTRNVPS